MSAPETSQNEPLPTQHQPITLMPTQKHAQHRRAHCACLWPQRHARDTWRLYGPSTRLLACRYMGCSALGCFTSFSLRGKRASLPAKKKARSQRSLLEATKANKPPQTRLRTEDLGPRAPLGVPLSLTRERRDLSLQSARAYLCVSRTRSLDLRESSV